MNKRIHTLTSIKLYPFCSAIISNDEKGGKNCLETLKKAVIIFKKMLPLSPFSF